jgi:hypothetical protein
MSLFSKYLSSRGLTIAGVIAVAGLVWTVEDRYISKAFAGDMMAAIQEIRVDMKDVRLQNDLRWWQEQRHQIEVRNGIGCSRCASGSDALVLFLRVNGQIVRLETLIATNLGR